MKYKMLSDNEKNQIMRLREGGMKYKDIGELLSAMCSIISTVLTKQKIGEV